MNKRAIARTTIVLALIVVILAAGLIYYATLPPPAPLPTPTPPPGPATINGKVTDAKTGAAVAGATVTLDGLKYTTGPDGMYSFSVKVGKYTVSVSMTGYETKTASVDASEEKTYTVNVSIPLIPPPTPDFVKTNTAIAETASTYQWLDPHVSYYQYDYWVQYHTVEFLLQYNGSKTTEIIPWLAESYTMINPKQYEFKLRKGITFQDGTPFNATAVWFSLNRLLIIDGCSGTGVKGSQAAWIVQQLLDYSLSTALSGEEQPYDAAWVEKVLGQNFVQIVDDYTVRLNIIHPTTAFEYLLSMPWASIISPTSTIAGDYPEALAAAAAGNYKPYFEHMAGNGFTAFNVPEKGWKIGTGPYYIESVDPTTYRIVLKAYPNYWGGPKNAEYPIGKPKITTIEYLYQPSFATRLLDLKAGKVTGIGVDPADLFSVADRDKWLNEGKLVSIIPGVMVRGPYPLMATWWFNFNTNVTTPTGELKKFQPFADWRIRMAVACAVNVTDILINVYNRMGILANNLIPPGTAPEGSYNPNIKPIYSFNLTKCEELLVDAWQNPMTSATHEMYFYNGTRIPPGVVDNSFSYPDKPAVVELYVQAGAVTFQKLLTTVAENLNRITWAKPHRMGLEFRVVPVPGGQQYTLASLHRIDGYVGGWILDYNHVMDWLGPMLLSTGTYFSWNLWNVTSLDDLYYKAVDADARGDVAELIRINNEMNRIANEMLIYMYWWHDIDFFVYSAWLKGWYMNTVYDVCVVPSMYFEAP